MHELPCTNYRGGDTVEELPCTNYHAQITVDELPWRRHHGFGFEDVLMHHLIDVFIHNLSHNSSEPILCRVFVRNPYQL